MRSNHNQEPPKNGGKTMPAASYLRRTESCCLTSSGTNTFSIRAPPANRAALAKIVEPWIDTCVSKGFNAIEPDNLDTFDRYGALTKENNLAFARLLSDYAHSKGLAFAQKNTAILVKADKVAGEFDFAIAEECGFFKECSAYTSLYGNFVLEIEYSDNENGRAVYDQACKDLGSKIPIAYRDRDVVPSTAKGYVNLHC
ncbi:hypothetical protein C8J57DRAFT_82694 [Mycena rebaudengoi]|nr:hypothetical protein C8J57DRAFT_82694 [Mycena rebaudengoi]